MSHKGYLFGARVPSTVERTIERMGRIDGVSYFARPVEPMS